MIEVRNQREKVRPEYLTCFFLVGFTLWAYIAVMGNDFINFDDYDYVIRNHYVKQGLTIEGVKWAFSTFHMGNWNPVTWLSHMLDCELYGLNAGKHHTTSLIIHIINSILLFFVFYKSTSKFWHSTFVALFFSLHPMHVESVAWIAERKDVLSTFFMLVTFLLYIFYSRTGRRSFYWLAFIFFALGLMAKPMIVTLPFLFLLFDYWPLDRIKAFCEKPEISKNETLAFLLYEKIPFFLLAGLFSTIAFIAQDRTGAVMTMEINPFSVRVCHAFISYVDYIRKLFWPVELSVFYPHLGLLSLQRFFFSLLIISIISIDSLYLIRKKPYFFIGWCWYLGTLVPVIGIVQVGSQAIADRYTYIPYTGLFITIIWGAYDLIQSSIIWKKMVTFCFGLLTLLCLFLTINQVSFWSDSITLFKNSLRNTKLNFIAHVNYAMALLDIKDKPIDEAIRHFEESIRINPKYSYAYGGMGLALNFKQDNEKAIQYYKKAIELDPQEDSLYYNIGIAYMNLGYLDEAIKYFKQSIKLNPNSETAYNGIGAVYAKKGDADNALKYFRKAYSLGFKQAEVNIQNLLKVKEDK